MKISVLAPNRIDLAGGTTDLYPLYLFMEGGCTVNVGITLNSRVEITTTQDPGIKIVSEDLGRTVQAEDPSGLHLHGPLGLICRAVRALPPRSGVLITTRNLAPAGSGLGASSALLTALVRGLLELRREEAGLGTAIDLAAEIETAAIGVPTGKQDYIGAAYGDVSLIDFGYRGYRRQGLSTDPPAADRLESMLILSFTGEGRFSGMNNWHVTKRFIDDEDGVREKLTKIRDIAVEMKEVLSASAWDDLPDLVNREWAIRRTLAKGVSTARTDKIMSAAHSAGALAGKICGAGGGGCMVTLARPELRSDVCRAIEAEGGTPIDFRIDRQGLTVTREDD